MRNTFLAAAASVALAAAPAQAGFVISAALGGAPDGIPGVVKQNFDSLTPLSGPATSPPAALPGMKVTFATNSQVAGLPNVSGVYAAPFLSGANGVGFGASGGDQPDGQNATPYLSVFGGSSITFSFGDDLKFLGVLWGSVDSYNTLELWLGGVRVSTITGSDVAALARIAATGSQAADGTVYVNIAATGGSGFDEARFLSGLAAFEFDNVAFATFVPPGGGPTEVPAPAALGLFGLALLGLAAARRRR